MAIDDAFLTAAISFTAVYILTISIIAWTHLIETSRRRSKSLVDNVLILPSNERGRRPSACNRVSRLTVAAEGESDERY